MKRLDLMSPEELAKLLKHFNGLGLDMTLERYVELKSELTDKEMLLAQEYDALGDDPARRDAIREALHNLRWRLNEDSARKYHTTGKGRRDTSMCEGNTSIPASRTSRFLTAKKLPEDILPKKLAHAMPTLRAIFRNVSDRARSIRELAEELGCSWKAAEYKYYADRKKLMSCFL